jgi:hypothetical protein
MTMDELDKSLATLIDDARTAHDPSAADARRVGAALGLVVPGLAASSALFSGAAHAATEVASQAAVSATAVKGAWLASVSTAKWLGVAVVVAAGAAAGVQPYITRTAHENVPAVLAPAARTRAPRMVEPLVEPKPVSTPAPTIEPLPMLAPPAPTPIELRASAARPTSARRIEPNARAGARTNQELQLVERALQALHDHDFERADRALREHATRFPSGTLVEERLGLQVLLACSRGDALAAAPLRARFLQLAPESPLAAKIARACER